TVAPRLSIEDGIESVRTLFNKLWIDEVKCAALIKALESYRREYDNKKKVYRDHPLHDWSSDAADAMRMLAVSLPKLRDNSSPEDLEKRYMEAVYGVNSKLPPFWQT